MSILVAKQNHFDLIMGKVSMSTENEKAIVRCRCQPNICSRPACLGCVQCLGRKTSEIRDSQLLTEFFDL